MSSVVSAPYDPKSEIPALRSDLGLRRPDLHTGIADWLTTVDHKKIGIMYGMLALFFFIIGGIEALMIRTQLAVPMNDFVSAQLYNQLFTMHGTTMIFLAVMPLSSAFFNFLVPLQIGARDVAFPRLNAFSLWTFVGGAIILNASWLFQFAEAAGWLNPAPLMHDGTLRVHTDFVPAQGWFGYAPLTGKQYTGLGTDFWIFGLQVLGVASIAASLNFIVTIINMRAPGMTMMRLPVFTWMTLITSFLIILAFPAITIALVLLMFDRFFGTSFFDVVMGGQPIFWQHLFWIFGHPEVYILILPAMGIISEILPTFSRKPLFGYAIVVFSGAVIGFLGFTVWSHHMFTTGLGKIATAAFSLLTMAIAIPTGVKIFNWIGTIWQGRVRFSVPMVFALGFIWMFMMGGFSGVMHSAAPADAQQQDSYFVVAHFHYVLIGGSVLAILAGVYYWFPLMTGKMLSQKLGYWVAALVVGGFNIAFFPMHYLGLNGMPRRTHTYLEGFGWERWNFVATIGAFILAVGIGLFTLDLLHKIFSKARPIKTDPWDSRTLEWSLPCPPPVYNFASIPTVGARDAWFAHNYGPAAERMVYPPDDGHGIHMPSQSWFPLIGSAGFTAATFGMIFVKTSFGPAVAIGGLLLLVVSIFAWAMEGPGGYHLHPPADPRQGDQPTPAKPVATVAHH